MLLVRTERPMASVALVTYNHEAYIREALDSILMQQVDFPYEIVAGDDCSQDGTQEILKEYALKYPDRFVLILRDANIGGTANSYDIKCHCRGKYIAQLEGDDFWTDPKKLQKQVDFLEGHPEYICCAHMHNVVDEDSRPIAGREGYGCPGTFTLEDYVAEGRLPGQTGTLVYRNIYLNPSHDYSIEVKAHDIRSDMTMMLILLSLGNVYTFTDSMGSCRYVKKKGGSNWTSLSMARDMQVEECLMSQRLLCWRRDEFGLDEEGQRRLRTWEENALILWLKRPGKRTWETLREVIWETQGRGILPWQCLKLLPRILGRLCSRGQK